ncbi:MAG: glycosyltransferase family 4 protein [Methanobacterium sp.]|jgi:glycosyltransferase involved in cell wall biosynthesis
MKILMLTAFFYPSLAGVETYVLSLSKNLALQGHKIDVLTMNTENAPENEEIFPNVNVKRCKISFNYTKGFVSKNFFKFLLESKDYDIYHAHIPFSFGLESAILASKINGIPLIVTHHGEAPSFTNCANVQSTISKIYSTFTRIFCLNFVDKIVFLTKSYCKSLWISPPARKKIKIVRTGSEIEKFLFLQNNAKLKKDLKIPFKDKIILFVGSLSRYNRYKGVDFLIKSMQLVNENDPHVKLLIIGDGELKIELNDLAEKCGVKEQVIFLGAIPNEEIPPYYSICDLVILPSIYGPENGPMVIFEAMASSKPVISTKLPGLIDIVENSFGILVPPKDINAIADSILTLTNDDKLRIKMGKNARKAAEKYSWKKCAKKMEKLYFELH